MPLFVYFSSQDIMPCRIAIPATLHRSGAARRLSGPVRFRIGGEGPDCVRDGDLALIPAPVDVLGVNYYAPSRLSAQPGSPLPFQLEPAPGYPVTAFGWPVVPAALTELLLLLRERYGDALPPVYITENGCSVDDAVAADGTVDDQPRKVLVHPAGPVVRPASTGGTVQGGISVLPGGRARHRAGLIPAQSGSGRGREAA
jgi:hypothetical protein